MLLVPGVAEPLTNITSRSHDLIDALKPGEQVIVDRGFAIESILIPRGAELVFPDFKGQGSSQLTEVEGKTFLKIAEASIHVESVVTRELYLSKTEE